MFLPFAYCSCSVDSLFLLLSMVVATVQVQFYSTSSLAMDIQGLVAALIPQFVEQVRNAVQFQQPATGSIKGHGECYPDTSSCVATNV